MGKSILLDVGIVNFDGLIERNTQHKHTGYIYIYTYVHIYVHIINIYIYIHVHNIIYMFCNIWCLWVMWYIHTFFSHPNRLGCPWRGIFPLSLQVTRKNLILNDWWDIRYLASTKNTRSPSPARKMLHIVLTVVFLKKHQSCYILHSYFLLYDLMLNPNLPIFSLQKTTTSESQGFLGHLPHQCFVPPDRLKSCAELSS